MQQRDHTALGTSDTRLTRKRNEVAYDEVMAYDITAGYPEKIELNISETNIISL